MLDTRHRVLRKVLWCFGKKSAKNTKNGGALIKLGVYLASGPIWNIPKKRVASGESNPARLGELSGNHLLHFLIKWREGVEFGGLSTLIAQKSLKISEEKKKEGKNPNRYASETFPWSIPWKFLRRSSFVLHRSSSFNRLVFDFEAFNSFYAPLVVHSCFVCFHLRLVYFGILFFRF